MKKIFTIIILITVLSFLLGCSDSKGAYYKDNYPLSDTQAFSKDGTVAIQLPKDWIIFDNKYSSSEKEINIISKDSSACILVTEIKTAFDVRELVNDEDLEVIGNVVFEMKKASSKDSLERISLPERFNVNGKNCYGYNFVNHNTKDTCRIVLLDTGKRYYEFLSFPFRKKEKPDSWNIVDLFTIQQTALKTFRWK
jgi:hypothetical protein